MVMPIVFENGPTSENNSSLKVPNIKELKPFNLVKIEEKNAT
jgi:hypothetical protein